MGAVAKISFAAVPIDNLPTLQPVVERWVKEADGYTLLLFVAHFDGLVVSLASGPHACDEEYRVLAC